MCGNEGIEKIEEVRDGGHDPVEKSGSWTNALALYIEPWTNALTLSEWVLDKRLGPETDILEEGEEFVIVGTYILNARLARSVERASLILARSRHKYSPAGPLTNHTRSTCWRA